MASEAYLAKLRDPRWQKMRLAVFERDNWSCQKCFDSKATLHVHHRYYQSGSEPWEYRPDALVTLCQQCHEDETELLRDTEADLILILKQCGAMQEQLDEMAGIFCSYTHKQLGPHEWSVLLWAVDQILLHRGESGGHWERAEGELKELQDNIALGPDYPEPKA